MPSASRNRFRTYALLALCLGALSACVHDPETGNPGPAGGGIAVPEAYTFESRFQDNTGSVVHKGQTTRNLLIQDLSSYIAKLGSSSYTGGAISLDSLLRFYEHKDEAGLSTITSTDALPPKEAKYAGIGPKTNIKGKVSSAILMGTGKTADQILTEWFQIIVSNSQDTAKLGKPAVYTDSNGLDLAQLINKVLLGSVVYYQATGVYMNDILNRNNDTADAGNPFTKMEHAWDEAFGYYGAAHDYARYTDAQLAGSSAADFTHDSDNDGKIDFESEYNFGFSRNAGKRDLKVPDLDLSKQTFDAFLAGRTAITNVGSQDEIIGYRTAVSDGWEKIIAATVVHYITEVKKDHAKLGTATEDKAALNKHWGEMKGFAWALQYNPFKGISDSQLTKFHELLGSAPITEAGYAASLDEAMGILKAAYGFTDANVAAW